MPDEPANIGGVNISEVSSGEIKTGDITTNVTAGGDIVGGDKIGGDKVLGNKNIFLTYIQMIPLPFIIAIGLGLLVTVGLGISNLNPIQAVLFPTSTPTSTPTATPGPTRMAQDSFGVAVTQIGYKDSQDHLQPSPDGDQLSDWIFTALRQEYEDSGLTDQYKIQIWHDSLASSEKGVTLGLIADAAEAQILAENIDADLVIYGYLVDQGNSTVFEPAFYLSPLPGAAGEVDEIGGPFRLGAAIPLELPLEQDNPVIMGRVSHGVTFQARALRWFTRGFLEDLAGHPSKAYQIFKQAEIDLTDWPKGGAGKEVLLYFIGREALTLGRDEQTIVANSGVFDSVDAALVEAESYFTRALTINPNYSRAQTGLAGVYYQRAQRQSVEERLAQPDMDQAINYFKQAQANAPAIPGETAALEASYGVAIASRLKGVTYRDGFPNASEAEVYFGWATVELNKILKPLAEVKQHRTLAMTYQALGVTYAEWAFLHERKQDWARAIELYQQAETAFNQCIAQADPSQNDDNPYDPLLNEIIETYCQPYVHRVKDTRLRLERE